MPMPVLYLSHGAPPLADDELWTRQLAEWSAGLPKPTAILIVSAHWENAPLTLGATTTVPLVYDFWGFPDRYYRSPMPAPGAPELAAKVRKLRRLPRDARARRADARPRPRRVRAAGGDVPGRGRAGPADLDAVAGPGRADDRRAEAGAAAGRGRADHRQRLLHPQPVPRSRWPTLPSRRPRGRRSSTTGARRRWPARDFDALLDFLAQGARPGGSRTRGPSTSRHCSCRWARACRPPTTPRSVIDGYWYGLAKRSVQFD